MIEYALLFALGFTTASLLVALISPAVHSRIVAYTETRLRATAPLGAQEVRAQKDMVRAVYAAENARLAHELKREADRAVSLKIASDSAVAEMERALRDEAVLKDQVGKMSFEAAELRAELRESAAQIEQLKAALRRSEANVASRNDDIETMRANLHRLEAKIGGRNQETATYQHQIEDLQLRLKDLRQEREALREDAKAAVERAQKAEQRLLQEEHTVLKLEDRLQQMQESMDKLQSAEQTAKQTSS
ncbi:chromosome segregation ATPase [Agrobacterium vitis]|nr:chromosome segregation ATPase [Agrobacterium vitis]MBE1436959.1 chromosome segregation ATPase [Agrobacterium vitis]